MKTSSYNFELAREIYGMNPWFVDQQSLPFLSGLLSSLNGGLNLETPETKYNTPFVYDVKSETRIINYSWDLRNNDSFEGIGVINIDGPITKSGGVSSMGMAQLSFMMLKMSKDNRVKAFIILGDSGGGSSNAVEIMVDTIQEVDKTKPVFGLVAKGGMAASAMYGIISACRKVYAESPMSIVGSSGTMIQFDGRSANSQAPDGTKYIRLYATKSTEKNKAFEEALNNDNYTLLINDLLDPINENFLDMIVGNRPILKGTNFDNGNTVFAKDAVGSYIDGIKSFAELVQEIELGFSQNPENVSNKNNNKSKSVTAMTVEELKNSHPATYNSIFNAGVISGQEQEKDRCGAWMAHAPTDIESVQKGIESGLPISQTQREQFLVKSASKQNLAKLEKDSSEAVNTPESGNRDKPTEQEAFYADVAKNL